MNNLTLEERVAALEKLVVQLMARLPSNGPTDWRSTIGMFANDPVMKEIQDAGQKIREADRRRAQKAAGKGDGKGHRKARRVQS